MSATVAAVIDVNAVRLETLRGAARDAAERIAQQVSSHPGWFDASERTRWGFALGEAYGELDRALGVTSRETAGWATLDAYRRTHAALARVVRSYLQQAAPWSRADLATALAFETAAGELEPILHNAHQAPRWLRERARRASTRG